MNVYSIGAYGEMIADRVRMDAYTQALRQAVKPDSVVLDIGTGTGIFALLACRYGARRVYGIEPAGAIQLARECAAANGYADRIEFVQALSTRVTLTERADVIISDLRGVLPLYQGSLTSLIDARRRLLAAGGTLIAQGDTLWAAVVEAPDLYGSLTATWDDAKYGFNLEAARRLATNTWRKGRVTPEQLLAGPQPLATLDYRTIETPDLSAEASWTAARAGTAHGLIVWFDTILAEGVGFSNAPGGPELIYGSAFFPWSRTVTLAVGDSVSVALRADLIGKDDYVWRWDTRVLDQDHPGQLKASFRQSSFYGAPLSLASLRKRAASYVPKLDADGEIDAFILARVDGKTCVGDIARQVCQRFPTRFTRWQDALTRVGELSQKYDQ